MIEEDTKHLKFDDNKDEVFAQLKDLFGGLVTSNVLNDICLKHNWQVENCTNDLIKYIENTQQRTIVNNNDDIVNREIKKAEMNYQDNSDDVVIEFEEFSSMPVPETDENPLPIESTVQQRNLGAVPKTINNQYRTDGAFIGSDKKTLDFSEIIKQNFKNFVNTSKPNVSQRKKDSTDSLEVQNAIKNIQSGYKVMIIMRGPPGCGKSYLAQYIVNKTVGNDFRNHIFSSDDYFYNIHDEYVYNREKLQEAHDYNQKRVKKKTIEGWSPIIVDNTNIKIWEMMPYAQIAVQNGYLIEIICPENDWCNSAGKLSAKNKHGVPKETIERMLRNYEPCFVDQLLKIANLRYIVPMPQYRHYPPLKSDLFTVNQILGVSDTSSIHETKEKTETVNTNDKYLTYNEDSQKEISTKISNVESLNSIRLWPKFTSIEVERSNENEQNENQIEKTKSESKLIDLRDEMSNFETDNSTSGIIATDKWRNYEKISDNFVKDSKKNDNLPKPQRNNSRIHRYCLENKDSPEETVDYNLPDIKGSEWKTYEEESNEFWNSNQTNAKDKKQQEDKSNTMDFVLNEPKPKRNLNETKNVNTDLISFLKDAVENNSENETKNDDKDLSTNKLEKHKLGCPNESKSFLMLRQIYQNKQLDGLWDLFEKCNGDVNWAVDILLKDDSCVDQQILNKVNLDQYFVCHCDEISDKQILNDDQEKENSPPEKMPRNKVKKEKVNVSAEMLEAKRAIEKQIVLAEEYYSENVKKIRNFRYGIENNDQNSQSTIAMTEPNTFQQDNSSNEIHIDNENDVETEEILDAETDDIVEIDLGKELVQQLDRMFNTNSNLSNSLYNFKNNVFMPKNLAKQLYAIWMESVYNQMEEQKQVVVKEDEEFARFLQNPVKSTVSNEPPKNFKEIMDMDLAWSFYKSDTENWKNYLPKDLASHLTRLKLYEIFPNIEKDTLLEILNAYGNSFSDTVEVLRSSLKSNLDEDIHKKAVDLLKQAKDENEMNAVNTEIQSKQSENQSTKSQVATDEAKKLALKDFEDNRNLAAHHSQLKAECYRKAKEAIQSKNHAVALYYSQVANLHKSKIEKFNQTAANCIMEIQNLNQNNPDVIDLHYLHVMEAVECLDVFIDKQITELRKICKRYKFVFIITGRGLHSAGGISAIKNKVKSRLKERYLTWNEVNPGLLKVKIYSASRYSENI